MTHKPRLNIFYVLLLIWIVVWIRDIYQYGQKVEAMPYSQFLQLLDQKKIKEVTITSDSVHGVLNDGTPNKPPHEFVTLRVEDPKLMDRLQAAGVQFGSARENTWFRDILSWILPLVIMFGLWSFLLNRFRNSSRAEFLSIGKAKAKIYVEKELHTRFTDVAGVDEVKDELTEVVNFLKDPSKYSRLGGRMPKGILLVGPPGTGKTLLARAVAGEAGVPFFLINGSEFVEMFVGLGAARVRDLFSQARAHAPCIIFIDELDALGKARGLSSITGSSNDEKEQTLNQLLAEIDGFDPSSGVVILAATNRPEILDPALLRSGRFDRQILVDKPDRQAREAILRVHIKNVRTAPDLKIEELASITAGFSGADLANLVNEAALIATRRGADSVQMQDFTEGVERIVAGLERKSRVLSKDDKRRVAYHEMGHAVVAMAVGDSETVHKITIIPRGLAALGYTFKRPTEDKYLMSRHELENKMAVLLGGRASEMQFFDDISTGAADDLDKATDIARAMITRFGMSDKLGLATLEEEPNSFLQQANAPHLRTFEYSQETALAVDAEIKRLLDQALSHAREFLTEYQGFVEEGAELLIQKETLDEETIHTLWQKHTGLAPPKPTPGRALGSPLVM